MASSRYDVVKKRFCIGYMVAANDIFGDSGTGDRSLKETERARKRSLEITGTVL